MNGETALRASAQGAEFDPEEGEERFTVHSRSEVAFILRQAMQNRQLVTAYFGGGDFALTSIIGVLPESGDVLLDPGPDEAANKRMLNARKVLLIASQDQVKIKFTADSVREVRYRGERAWRIGIPESLLRIQRREHYRIATPITLPLICTIPLPERGAGHQVETVVFDISCGGAGLIDSHRAAEFETGKRFENCRIGLPEIGTIVVGLEVRTVFDTAMKNGTTSRRAGCQFVNLCPAGENQVQRYIMQLERERKVRTGR